MPEMHEGGAERNVLWLSNELSAMGQDGVAVSAGGKLEADVHDVQTVNPPVHT